MMDEEKKINNENKSVIFEEQKIKDYFNDKKQRKIAFLQKYIQKKQI